MPKCKKCHVEISDLEYKHHDQRCLNCLIKLEILEITFYVFFTVFLFALNYWWYLMDGFPGWWIFPLIFGVLMIGVSCLSIHKLNQKKKLLENETN